MTLRVVLCQKIDNTEEKKTFCNQVHQSMTLDINKYFALVVDSDVGRT